MPLYSSALLFFFDRKNWLYRRHTLITKLSRPLFLVSGCIALSLGIIGIFLPLLPTTPFVILAAYCFSKGSKSLHQWLLNDRLFGSIIKNWEQHGVIRPHVKIISALVMIGTLSYPVFFLDFHPLIKGSAITVCLVVILFLLTRPSRPRTP